MEALLIEVNQVGLGRGLHLSLFRPSSEQMKDFYAELPILVKVEWELSRFWCICFGYRQVAKNCYPLNNLSIAPMKDSGVVDDGCNDQDISIS